MRGNAAIVGLIWILTAAIICLPAKAAWAADPAPPPGDRTEWFRQAKFGMFIHWGLYAIPAGRWNGQSVPGIGEWIMNHAKIPVAQYAQLAGRFNPVKFDADRWVQIAQSAGMKYMVLTSKHHDGFAMFGSRVSPYNVVDGTPFHRDVLKELSQACVKHGMRLGVYYSQAQDWHHPGGAVIRGSWDPAQKGDFDQYLDRIALPQVKELLTGYGPLALVWFDTPVNMTAQRAQRFAQTVRQLQPACLINSRILKSGREIGQLTPAQRAEVDRLCDYSSRGDNEIPQAVTPGLWETPATLNHTWGFKRDDQDWKSPADLVTKLVDIVSKGGNYLLNVGPTAEGEIPAACIERLQTVGQWLKVNGEAIYGAGPTVFGQEFGHREPQRAGQKKDKKEKQARKAPAREGVLDWRCTTRPGRLYIHLLTWPGESFELTGLAGPVRRAYLLADPARTALSFTLDGGKLTVRLPEGNPGRLVTVLCLETQP